MKIPFKYVLFVLITSQTGFGQINDSSRIDYCQNILSKTTLVEEDFQRLDSVLFQLNYYQSSTPVELYHQSILKAEQSDKLKKYAGIFEVKLADLYWEYENLDSSTYYIEKAVKRFEFLNEELEYARTANVRRQLKTSESDFLSAYDVCFEALEIFQKYNDRAGIGVAYRDIGSIMINEKKYTDALISCPTELNLFLDNSGNLLIELADSIITSTDNCGMWTVDYFPSSFDCSDLGPTIVVVTIEDVMGNQASCQIEVTLQESPKLVTNLSNNSPGSLRKLIEGSCGGAESIIYFDTTLNGTIQLVTNQILIDKDIEIVGLGKDIINIDANNAMRIFEITPLSVVTLRGLQLSKGEEVSDGGAFLNQGVLNLDNIRFLANRENGTSKAFTNNGVVKIISGVVEVNE